MLEGLDQVNGVFFFLTNEVTSMSKKENDHN